MLAPGYLSRSTKLGVIYIISLKGCMISELQSKYFGNVCCAKRVNHALLLTEAAVGDYSPSHKACCFLFLLLKQGWVAAESTAEAQR